MKAATIVSIAPMRKEASHRSEMVSQLLMGECVEVLETDKDFFYVKCLYDGYEGWCQQSQLTEVDDHFYNNNHKMLVAEPITQATCNDKSIFLVGGSFVGCFKDDALRIGNSVIRFTETPYHFNEINESVDIYEVFKPYVNTPYLWGGKSIFGIDCSGFTQQVFKMLDVVLPRDAYQQATLGENVGFLQEAQLGDLAFFDNEEGKITHVGIILNDAHIIHASGKVRIDKIDNMGIVNTETNKRTHQLRIIKRFLS